ncbi:uncharacterized protein TM35_000101590 [Trypanosoma theileri]|uniref:CSC1/OSCA1-like 7TM region domain-containing protein n=1 Tax=Trypanosoma theileri TaxID=67003 RepID=A0A1X0NZ70_9TRYP|nr:uncharacterized protein TM35_000101590 [Trypanosoma theileri]ORC89891.1 hypothetical protein TM35_000101590 [Trypanosoma theileri]
MDFSLGPRSTWDDQGLWFALILNSTLFVILVSVSLFFHLSPYLVLRRRYRANHTVVLQLTSLTASHSDNTESPDKSATGTWSSVFSASRASRISRVGRALRYPCTLTSPPSWRCWLSIEEKAEHIENVFPSAVGRFPYANDESSSSTTGDGSLLEDIYNGDDSHVEVRASYSPEIPEERKTHEEGKETTGGEGVVDPALAREEEEKKKKKEHEIPHNLQFSTEEVNIKKLTKIPLDPEIALYLFFLKLFITIFFVGAIFNIWICVLSGTDGYIERYAVSRDIHNCHRQDTNETGCIASEPFCRYIVDTGCFPVPLKGLYDLSAQNITPRSWRLWVVAFLDMGFGLVYMIGVIYYVHHVDAYISTVMRVQMENSLGHRVALVRSLKNSWASDTKFREKFLVERAYFGLPGKKKNGNAPAENEDGNNYNDNDDTNDDESEVYHYLDCTGLGCLFSIFSFNYYKTTRKNAVFTKYGKVEQLLFPRDPPRGMYKYIGRTEKAMEAFQEAVADMKKYYEQQEQGGNHHPNSNVLLMRAPFPSCCRKVSRVDYWKEDLIANATKLNKYIEDISSGDVKGCAFIVFADALSAYEFVNLFEARVRGSSHTRASIAGPPEGIIQINVTADRYSGWVRTLLALGVYLLLLVFWSVPVGFLGSLDNLARIPGIGGPIYKFYLSIPNGLRGIFTAYVPVLLLYLLNLLLPIIIKWFVIFMGAVNEEELNGGILYLQYLFMVLTGVIFQAALQGGFFQLADLISEPSSVATINFFVAMVSPQGGYWYANVIMASFVTTWLALIDPVAIFLVFCRRRLVSLQRVYDNLFKSRGFTWASLYSSDLTILAMGLLFHMTVPLLAVFVGIYLLLRYITQRGRLLDSHRPSEHPRRCGHSAGLAACAQVMRAATSLHAVGGVGGVLFMSLRRHVGGVVVCSITLAGSILLMLYVFAISRRWVASLANARRLLGHDEEIVGIGQYGATAKDTAREEGGKVGKLPRGSGGKKAKDVVVTEGSTMQQLSERLMADKEHSHDDDNDNNNNSTNNNNNNNDNDNKYREIMESLKVQGEEKKKREEYDYEDDDDYEGEEYTARNYADNKSAVDSPTSKRLPCQSDAVSKYQPKHQQLVQIDIDEEIRCIEEAVYRVDRYWDVPFAYLDDNVNYTEATLPVVSPFAGAGAAATTTTDASPHLREDEREGSVDMDKIDITVSRRE